MTAAFVIASVLAIAAALLRPGVRSSESWRATVTPLASIIGSGFLVVTPLLSAVVGPWAPLAMAGIVGLAYWVGSAMRLVIAEVEPELVIRVPDRALVDLDRLSRLLLGFAYVASVAFYLRLMSVFVLRAVGDGDVAAQLLTTAVLVAIGAVGWLRGLHGLETLEEMAVGIKLAIIGGLIVGLAIFNAADPSELLDAYQSGGLVDDGWRTARVLAGMLLVVQGFETSRYLGAHYDAPLRIVSMRRAQLLSAGLYIGFVTLGVRTFGALPTRVDETAILDMAREVTPMLVPLLIIAAVASQLSAAVADTAGGGEMFTGSTRMAPTAGVGYVLVAGAAIAIVWLTDVFTMISFASRAFAAYYFTQILMLLVVIARSRATRRRSARLVSYGVLLVVLALVVVFAVPVEG